MAKKNECYVVWRGRATGIFDTWKEAQSHVDHYSKAIHMKFENKFAAEKAFAKGLSGYFEQLKYRNGSSRQYKKKSKKKRRQARKES